LVVEPTHLKNMLVELDHFPNDQGEHEKYERNHHRKQGKTPPLRAYSRDLSRGQLACDPEKLQVQRFNDNVFLGILGVHKKTKKHPTTWCFCMWICRGFLFACPSSYTGVWHCQGSTRRFEVDNDDCLIPGNQPKHCHHYGILAWLDTTYHGIYVSYESYLIDPPSVVYHHKIHNLTPNFSSCSKRPTSFAFANAISQGDWNIIEVIPYKSRSP